MAGNKIVLNYASLDRKNILDQFIYFITSVIGDDKAKMANTSPRCHKFATRTFCGHNYLAKQDRINVIPDI